jgi:hypothetical protein
MCRTLASGFDWLARSRCAVVLLLSWLLLMCALRLWSFADASKAALPCYRDDQSSTPAENAVGSAVSSHSARWTPEVTGSPFAPQRPPTQAEVRSSSVTEATAEPCVAPSPQVSTIEADLAADDTADSVEDLMSHLFAFGGDEEANSPPARASPQRLQSQSAQHIDNAQEDLMRDLFAFAEQSAQPVSDDAVIPLTWQAPDVIPQQPASAPAALEQATPSCPAATLEAGVDDLPIEDLDAVPSSR